MKHLCYEEELRFFCLEVKKAQGYLIYVYNYCTREGVQDRARLFSAEPSDKARGNGHKLKQEAPSGHEKTGFDSQGDQALAKVAQGGCGVSLPGDKKPMWIGS